MFLLHKRISRLFIIGGLCLLSSNVLSFASDEFPILAWYSLKPPLDTKEKFIEMRDAGFNLSLSFYNSIDDVKASLESAAGTGIKLLVFSPELEWNVEHYVSEVGDYPALAGYFILDEPNVDYIRGYCKAQAQKIKKYASSKPVYINLLPNYALPEQMGVESYEEYLETAVNNLLVDFISFDHYPVTYTGFHENYYENLEMVSRLAKKINKPFWGFARVVNENCPNPTKASIGIQIYSNIAYGAQGIEYYTYTSKGLSHKINYIAPLDSTGVRTYVYDCLKEVNKKVHAFSSLFIRMNVKDVIHVGQVPISCKGVFESTAVPQVSLQEQSNGEGFVVSYFVNNGGNYIMVVNKDIEKSQSFHLTARKRLFNITESGSKRIRRNSRWEVPAGDFLIFRF